MTKVTVLSGPERRRRWTSAEKLRLIAESDTKFDRADARLLARLAHVGPALLSPIHTRSAQTQLDLAVIRALYMRPSAELQFAAGGQPPRDLLLQLGVLACVAVAVGSFFGVQPLIDLARHAVQTL